MSKGYRKALHRRKIMGNKHDNVINFSDNQEHEYENNLPNWQNFNNNNHLNEEAGVGGNVIGMVLLEDNLLASTQVLKLLILERACVLKLSISKKMCTQCSIGVYLYKGGYCSIVCHYKKMKIT